MNVPSQPFFPHQSFVFPERYRPGGADASDLDPVKKAELRLEFVNQKLTEASEVAENKPNNEQAVNKALKITEKKQNV